MVSYITRREGRKFLHLKPSIDDGRFTRINWLPEARVLYVHILSAGVVPVLLLQPLSLP